MNDLQLVGKLYPIHNTDNKVVGYKRITSSYLLSNMPAVVVGFGNQVGTVYVDLVQARRLQTENEDGLPIFELKWVGY